MRKVSVVERQEEHQFDRLLPVLEVDQPHLSRRPPPLKEKEFHQLTRKTMEKLLKGPVNDPPGANQERKEKFEDLIQ